MKKEGTKLNGLRFTAQGYVDGLGQLQAKIKELEEEAGAQKAALRDALAALEKAGGGSVVEAEEYLAKLVPTTVTEVNLREFRKVCPPKLFLDVVRIEVGQARKLCSEALAKVAVERPGTPRVVVERKEKEKG